MKIIFDYNRTLYDPNTDSLYKGVVELLQYLSKDNELFLISKNEPGRKDRLVELGIDGYFVKIIFVEKKTVSLFRELSQDDKNILVIGDRIADEILIGNQLGFITVWVQQGKFATDLPERDEQQPRHIVQNIQEIKNIFSKYEK